MDGKLSIYFIFPKGTLPNALHLSKWLCLCSYYSYYIAICLNINRWQNWIKKEHYRLAPLVSGARFYLSCVYPLCRWWIFFTFSFFFLPSGVVKATPALPASPEIKQNILYWLKCVCMWLAWVCGKWKTATSFFCHKIYHINPSCLIFYFHFDVCADFPNHFWRYWTFEQHQT